MTSASDRYRQRAERHRARAVSYQDDASLLLTQYQKPDSAGALLYEAVKQCINALANQDGQNLGSTGAKKRYLESLSSQPLGGRIDLEQGWEAAMRLHVHADRGHLTDPEITEAWLLAQVFIDDMLSIYAAAE